MYLIENKKRTLLCAVWVKPDGAFLLCSEQFMDMFDGIREINTV